MNINRHNYEEFFLLYIDNELQRSERVEVEDFVKQNPDLASELEMLKEATLSHEDLTFDNKDLLYKKEDGISLNNYEEYFLLSIDNELADQEADEVEKFVLKHPQLQDEFTLLKQTKLEPEMVEFTGKEKLYKTEKERRNIPFSLVKMGVAAAVIGLIAFTWIFDNKETGNNQNSIAASAKQAIKTTENKNSATAVTQQGADALDNKSDKGNEVSLAVAEAGKAHGAKSTAARSHIETASVYKRARVVQDKANDAMTVDVAKADPKSVNISETPERVTANSSKPVADNSANTSFAAKKNSSEATSDYANNAVYREINTDEDDNSVSIGGAQINKNKLKGLFKKAVKLLGKKGSDNEESKTVHIAVFEFKTK